MVLLNPSSVNAGGTQATVAVPGYFNGAFTLRVFGSSFTPTLQVVPVVTTVTVTGTHQLNLTGKGFVEGNNSVYNLAGTQVTDTSTSSTPIDVYYYSSYDNTGVNLSSLPSHGAGTLTVVTAGGTSAGVALNAGLHIATTSDDGGLPLAPLTADELAPIVVEARSRWAAAGLSAADVSLLAGIRVQVADLDDGEVGEASDGVIYIDATADGTGWFVDPTPQSDDEFTVAVGTEERDAAPGSPAYGKLDLLTVVMHEMGHEIGLDHVTDPNALMNEDLGPGIRREPPGLAWSVVATAAPMDPTATATAAAAPITTTTTPATVAATNGQAQASGAVGGPPKPVATANTPPVTSVTSATIPASFNFSSRPLLGHQKPAGSVVKPSKKVASKPKKAATQHPAAMGSHASASRHDTAGTIIDPTALDQLISGGQVPATTFNSNPSGGNGVVAPALDSNTVDNLLAGYRPDGPSSRKAAEAAFLKKNHRKNRP